MANNSDFLANRVDYLLPRYSYQGNFTPENLAFNANLQEFSQRVSYICNLETGGKITSLQAYEKIQFLWDQLKASKEGLSIEG